MSPENSQPVGKSRNILLIVAIVVMLGAAVTFQFRGGEEAAVDPISRNPTDFVVEWRCATCNHSIQDKAGLPPRPCPQCEDGMMYPVLEWYCRDHGAVAFFAKYNMDGEITEIQFPGSEWRSPRTEEGGWDMTCPKCGKALSPQQLPGHVGAPVG